MEIEDRFWAKVSKDADGCWRWTATKIYSGYGQFSVNGKLVRVHRFSYELANGPIPEGLVIDHMCRTRECVNPEHLRAVTQRENIHADGSECLPAKNLRRGTCRNGHLYTKANTLRLASGHRICRTCHRATDQRYKEKKRRAGR